MNRSREPNILLVDDDRGLLQLIAMRLSASGYAVTAVESGEAALASLEVTRPQLVVTDLRMEGIDGLALVDAIHRKAPGIPVVILTAHGTIPDAVSATRRGVFSFLTKPFDPKVLLETVAEALQLSSAQPTEAQGDVNAWRADIVTCAPSMEDVLARARRVAGSDASVCIYGASGTGKELLARAIHRAGPRAEAPFVAVNCAAIPEGLLESELFGHKRGAFTGAVQDRRGLFEAAYGGTLFLDEVGDMPLALQVKLLRATEERVVRPVGSNVDQPINVRIICATHQRLEELVAQGEFREDLYYRLNVVQLELPSLAERREDIPLLAEHFLARLAERYGRPHLALSPEAMRILVAAPWPGNIRQLLNVIEQAVALASTEVIPASLVRQVQDADDAALVPLEAARRAFERDYLARVLKITGGNVTHAARLSGRNRTEFYRLLARNSLDPSMFKQRAAQAH
ncbi:MAG: sigma 54-interacting transcriptional regulator [Betaproteobacteria bacterium]|jgi:two-component system response regulator GlrR|nr:sigma 54-interacting transcriptional regulator [Betaproteobacteria bacterium]